MTPRLGSAMFDLATSIVAYLALTAVMFVAARVSFVLALVLAVPAAGFLLRTFIVFHDCAHGSFLPSRRGNALLGAVLEPARLTAVPELAARARRPSRDGRRPRPPRRRRRPRR